MTHAVTTITATIEDYFIQPVTRTSGLLARATDGVDVIVSGAVHNLTTTPTRALVGHGPVHLTALRWREDRGHRQATAAVITPVTSQAHTLDKVHALLTAPTCHALPPERTPQSPEATPKEKEHTS